MSDPPPMPVSPTRVPTPNPKRTMNGSTAAKLAVQAALRLVCVRPAAAAPTRGKGAVGAADRLVAAVVQRVVRKLVLEDVAPHLRLAPVRERVGLPETVAFVERELRREAARLRLLAPQAGDPAVHVGQRAPKRRYLADAAARVGVRLPQLRPVHGLLVGERHAPVDV